MMPRATYRLQFRDGMNFAKAIAIVPYLEKLGISHLYASPIYAAVRGSTHGYDVIDNNVVEPELGGMDGLLALSDRLKSAGMGLIVDIVPNHMAASLQNPWWRDVVEWGAMSRYAESFDIDWRRKLTLPILASGFEGALAADELSVKLDEQGGGLVLAYFDNLQPLHPHTYGDALAPIGTPLAYEIAACATNADPWDKTWKDRLRRIVTSRSTADLHHALSRFPRSHIDRLHERQPWRLIGWRDAARVLSYRRFFEIAGLVGLKVEKRQVFDTVHELTFALLREDIVQGLRIDHVDGLADPRTYLNWLRAAVGPDTYVIVEKILAENEKLPVDWPVEGTTGYEFIPTMARTFIDPAGRNRLEDAYAAERPHRSDIEEQRYKAKRLIVENNFAGELARLVQLAQNADARYAGVQLERLIRELIAAFPVYRTYGDSGGMNDHDIQLLREVADVVRRTVGEVDESTLDRLVILLAEGRGEPAAQLRRRFQQLSSAVMAKAVEDTLFYRWHAFVAVNEVGSDPARSTDLGDWHAIMDRREAPQSRGLLATATHDTKRGEDSRARLYALSERPQEWLDLMRQWRELAPSGCDGATDDPEIRWLIFQSLTSIWPHDGDCSGDLVPRLVSFLEKALREAKLRTSWTKVDTDYERAWTRFAERLLHPDNGAFLDEFTSALRPYIQGGWINSLGQTLLKLTVPGIPDIYQGSEIGDFSLVDPDNRRPVDFDFLAQCLKDPLPAIGRTELFSGRMKQKLIAACLSHRRRYPDLFEWGSFERLKVLGSRADQTIAFLRRRGSVVMVVLVPRLTFGLGWPAKEFWQDTRVVLSQDERLYSLSSVLCGTSLEVTSELRLSDCLAQWPVALISGGDPITAPSGVRGST